MFYLTTWLKVLSRRDMYIPVQYILVHTKGLLAVIVLHVILIGCSIYCNKARQNGTAVVKYSTWTCMPNTKLYKKIQNYTIQNFHAVDSVLPHGGCQLYFDFIRKPT